MQEMFLAQREEEANCHEQAMQLRQVKLVEMQMAVKLKKMVAKTRMKELKNVEQDQEQEVESYRDEVHELQKQLHEQQALSRRQAVALQQQKRTSAKRLQLESNPSSPPTRPWHHMRRPENERQANGANEEVDPVRAASMPTKPAVKKGAMGSMTRLLSKAASFASAGAPAPIVSTTL